MDRGWVLHTPGPASCTGWQSTRWYHPCTPEIWNQDSGGKTSLHFTVIIVSHSISRGLGNIEQTPLRKSATYSRKKASKFNVSYFFSFSVLLTCCSVTSSVIKASRSSITTLHRSQLRLFESLTVSMSSTLEPDTFYIKLIVCVTYRNLLSSPGPKPLAPNSKPRGHGLTLKCCRPPTTP